MRQGIASIRRGTLSQEVTARQKERGKVTLAKGGENFRVCDGDGERSQGRRRRIKCGRESQAAGEEPCRGKSWLGNENTTTSAPSTLGIPGGAAGRFTNEATTLSGEGNTSSTGKKSQALYRVLMGGNPMLQNTVGGGNGMGGGTRTTAAPTAGQQKGEGRGSKGFSSLTEAVKYFGPAATTHEF